MDMKDLFVTYSWDSQLHNDRVIAFVNHLRNQGFAAEMDRMLMQQESAIDFSKMMHRIMTDYRKVIVVLSEGYKQKAEQFTGGVGNCIVPGDGEGFFSRIFQANLWEKYHMAAPRQRRQLGALSSKVQKAYKR